jgi:ribosomal protein L11 methyltransferase
MGSDARAQARYPHVTVEVRDDEAEAAGDRLFELGARGVEQRDATTLLRGAPDAVTLVASFDDDETAREAIACLPVGWAPHFEEVVGDAWRDEWRKYFEPFAISKSVIVRPPWRPYAPQAHERVVVLEPGRAFGTGLHETTMLIAEILEELSPFFQGKPVLDVGTGSGVVALVALALGASAARAVDIDPDAVGAARENADRNGLGTRVDVDGADVAAICDRYPMVLANIDAPTLVGLAPALVARISDGGRLVLSGLLDAGVTGSMLEEVRRAYGTLVEEKVRRKGEWVALVMRR